MKSKKFLALLLSFVMILASSVCTFNVSAAGEPTVTIGSATAKAGETVTVTVDFANNPGVAGMRCDVIYDTTNLTLTTITDKGVIGGQTHNAEENIIFWNNASNQTNSGVVAEFTFAINANAPAGDYKIGLSYNNDDYDIINESFDTIDVAVVEGTITVEAGEQPPVVNKYTVTYKVDGEVVKTFEDVVEGTATPTCEYTAKEGYTFSGWGEVPATVTENLVIEGTTTVNKYTVTYKVDGEVVNTAEVAYGAVIPAYNYEVAEGYTFSGWDAEIPATMPAKDLVFNGTTTKDEEPEPPVVKGPTMTIGNAKAKAGETVTVTVDFANNPGVAGMRCDVIYDTTNLTLTTITDKGVIGGQTHNAEENIIFWNNASNQTNSGVVAEFTFAINANAPAGDYKIGLSYNNDDYDIINESFDTIDVAVVEGTITVEAGEQPPVVNKYTVTYKVDGEVVKTFEDVVEGTATPTCEYTAKEGYTFSGWGEVPATVTENLVIEGTTTVNKYTVTYKVDGEVVNTAEVAYGAVIPAYNYEVAEGYTFSGWDAEVPATMPAKNLEFNGETTKIIVKYTVTFKAEGADDIVIEVEEGKAIGDALAADATKEGLEFAGWFTAEGVEVTAETVVNGDIVATAKFQRIVGDVNCDGVKDSKDAIYLLNHCALPDLYPVDGYEYTLDMNGDGVVSSLDAIYLLNSIAIPALYSLAW